MPTVTISRDHRITIPREVRELLGVGPGDRLGLLVEGRSVHLVPVVGIDALTGIAPGVDTSGFREKTDRF